MRASVREGSESTAAEGHDHEVVPRANPDVVSTSRLLLFLVQHSIHLHLTVLWRLEVQAASTVQLPQDTAIRQ